jgi:hypothetical protein
MGSSREKQMATPTELALSQRATSATASNVKVVSPAPREAWRDITQADPNALVTQSPAWVDTLCAITGAQDASRHYEMPDGQRLILPLARQAGLLRRMASMPSAWGFGGLLSAQPIRAEHVAAVFDDLATLPALQITLRPNPLDADAWQAGAPSAVLRLPRRAHAIDLAGGFDAVSKRFDTQAKRNMRKAEREGVSVECDASGRLVPEFYELFLMSLERWAGKQHEPNWLARWRGQRRDPMSKFVQMSQGMAGACRWYVARVNGKPAGAILVLMGKNAHYTRGAMDRSLASTGANFLLHRTAIEDACKAGCRWYHMGETGNSESLSNFKEHFGAQPYAYAEYRVERLPLTKTDTAARNAIKKLIGFKDA